MSNCGAFDIGLTVVLDKGNCGTLKWRSMNMNEWKNDARNVIKVLLELEWKTYSIFGNFCAMNVVKT